MVKSNALQTDLRKITEPIYQLNENIVEKLSHRSRNSGLSENSKATYQSIIRDFNRFLAFNELHISSESLQRYFDEIKKKYRAATLNLRKYALLKIIKAELGENNILLNMAIEKVFEQIDSYQTSVAVPYDECLTEVDIETLLNGAKTEKTKLIIQFLFKTGCRVSEMINIRMKDCRPMKGYVKIIIMGKGNKEREVVIPSELYIAIRNEYQGKHGLFESRSGKPLNRHNIKMQIKKAGANVGLPQISPHSLRHARATDMLLNKNISLKAVSKYLGHSSTATTADMYIHDEFDALALFRRDRI